MISTKRLAFTHILFEITAVVDLLGISVYWTQLHAGFVESMKNQFWPLTHMYLVHSFPTICLFIVYMTTEKLVIKQSHWWLLAPIVPVYASINYFETKRRGYPLYWFLNWEDFWTTCAVIVGILFLVIFIWIMASKATKWGKSYSSSNANSSSKSGPKAQSKRRA